MKKYHLIFLSLLSIFACEEPEPLTADDFVNEDLQKFLNPPFQVEVDRATFFEESVTAAFAQGQLTVRAIKGNEQIAFTTNGIQEGIYSGMLSNLNQIYFQEDNEVYTSLRANGTNQAEIVILEYNKEEDLISGTFKGQVVHSNQKERLSITNGKFNDLKVEIPFTGEMNATLSTRPTFSSLNCQYISSSNLGVTVETITAYTNGNQQSINIIIRRALSPGIFNLSDTDVSFTYNDDVFNTDPVTIFTGQSGNIQVISINQTTGEIKGTFEVQTQNFNGEILNFQMGTFTAVVP